MRLSPCPPGAVRQIAYPGAIEPVPSWGRVLGVCLDRLDGRSTPPSMCSSRVRQWPPESGRPHRSGKTPIGVGKLPCQWACATVAPGAGEGHRRGRWLVGTDVRYWHQRALSAPARVVDMSARYIPLAVSTTPSRCRQPPRGVDDPLTMSTTRARVGNPLTVSTTRAHARARRMPQSGLGLQLGGIMPPACLGDSLGRRRAPRDASDAPVPGGCPIFCCSGRNETKDAPSCLGIACARPASGERPHAPGLAGPGGRRGRPGGGTPARAPGLVPGPASPRLSATPGGTRTRTLIYRTRTAHKGAIPPLCAAPCSLIPFLVCDTEKERGQDPRGTRRTGHSCCTA